MIKSIFGIMTFIFALLMGQSVYADSDKCEAKMKKMVQELKLDADQHKKVETIYEQFKTSQKDNWNNMKSSHDLIMQQVQSDAMDEAKLDQAVNQKTQQLGMIMKAKAKMKNQIYVLLKPEQKAKFIKMMKDHEEKIKKMFKKCDE